MILSIQKAKDQFCDLVTRARMAHETTVVTYHGRPVAMLVPIDEPMPCEPAAIADAAQLPADNIAAKETQRAESEIPQQTTGAA